MLSLSLLQLDGKGGVMPCIARTHVYSVQMCQLWGVR